MDCHQSSFSPFGWPMLPIEASRMTARVPLEESPGAVASEAGSGSMTGAAICRAAEIAEDVSAVSDDAKPSLLI
jgi:hypothetical protein